MKGDLFLERCSTKRHIVQRTPRKGAGFSALGEQFFGVLGVNQLTDMGVWQSEEDLGMYPAR